MRMPAEEEMRFATFFSVFIIPDCDRLCVFTGEATGEGKDEMPSAVVIYSDMEFNRSVTNPDDNLFADCREAFEKAGYEMPAVVFHNVNSLQMQTPVLSDTAGTALSSGRTTHHMKHRYTRSTTPLMHMLEVLLSDRYAPIHA